MAKKRILILFGGTSAEHTGSLKSAAAVMRVLPAEQYEIVPVGIDHNGRWLYFPGGVDEIESDSWEDNSDCSPAVLSPDPAHSGILILEDGCYSHKRIDVIFSTLHGKNGEDGAVQGLFELTGIPYIGNGVLGSAVCRNKAFTHKVLSAANIRTPKWSAAFLRDLNRLDYEYDKIEEKLDYPVYVKPSSCEMSMATGIAKNRTELATLVKRAFTQDGAVLIEELILGRELRVAVFGYDLPFASFVGEVTDKQSEKLTIPADLDEATVDQIRKIAVRAFCVLDCKGFALFDFFLAADGEILLGEVNTMPTLTETAVYPLLMENLGMTFPYLINKMIEQAIEHADRAF